MINVILSGGIGTRLWPLSRTLMPKQFLKIFDNRSLFDLTLSRNAMATRRIIICNEANYFIALDECKTAKNFEFILEPFGKNTAAAIAMAALSVDENEILLITPSDHFIKDHLSYKKAIELALDYASDEFIVTFGITPDSPHTGYGYIKTRGHEVTRFVEKPSLNVAQTFLKEGGYYFNSGMFCFRAKTFLDQFKQICPEIYSSATLALENAKHSNNITTILPRYMQDFEDISIDYAFMQKANKVAMVELDAGWSDMGSFDELAKNVSPSKFYSVGSNDNFVMSDKLVGLVDVSNLLVIDTADALLISHKGSSQTVKQLYSQILTNSPKSCETHTLVFRPWGSYEILKEGENFKVKRLIVHPNKRLSLQSHSRRSEHWVVVSGEAIVHINERETKLVENQSIYISQGDIHRLTNAGDTDLVVIEAQVGEYLGEDDIIRYDDDYDRV